MARQLSESAKLFRGCEPSGFEPAHLARRGTRSHSADDPAHCWIVTQTLGIDIKLKRLYPAVLP